MQYIYIHIGLAQQLANVLSSMRPVLGVLALLALLLLIYIGIGVNVFGGLLMQVRVFARNTCIPTEEHDISSERTSCLHAVSTSLGFGVH